MIEEFLNAFIEKGYYEEINSVLNKTVNGLVTAVFCKHGQHIVDLIIPIAMISGDDTKFQHSNMSFIDMQIKNRKKNITAVIGNLNEESRGIEYQDIHE
ncbi:11392_t:CDS:2 [Funneliformis mosseae]|uniref:11392_t:CDS:1 n=1 Tax=Funneliformis mosseae TaxID=27381 RepID=A0A9N9CS13_FUNMO|nr:11392_t:CDS:2 [Funneliformis mosseae]